MDDAMYFLSLPNCMIRGEIKNNPCGLVLVFFMLWPEARKSLLVSACVIVTREGVEPPTFCSLF